MKNTESETRTDSTSWATQQSIAIMAVDNQRPSAQCLELMDQIDAQKITYEQAVAAILQKAAQYAGNAAKPPRFTMNAFPDTSEQNYITGKAALNIANEGGFPADWHFTEVFLSGRGKIRIAGQDTPETAALLGNYGIRECGGVLRQFGVSLPTDDKVYAANHIRAILDMVINSILKNRLPEHVTVHDMLDATEDVAELQTQVNHLKTKLTDQIALSLLTEWEKKYIHFDPYS